MLDVEFYNLLMDAFDALYSAGSTGTPEEPQPAILQLRAGLAESPGWFLIQAAEFDPDPLAVANLRVRDVYASERLVQALLELMASEQWLDRSAQGTYALTAKGRAALQRRLQRRHELAVERLPVPVGEVDRIAALLGRLIEASMAAPVPPGSWCLAHSRRRAPAQEAPVLARIAQYFSDFNAFRDDAHMAAWQSYTLDGYVWEAFSLVFAGAADSAASVFAQLAHRGYSCDEYAAALEVLARRSWLEQAATAGTYRVTADGRAVRAVVERLTDSYFYAPWSCLAEDEVAELHALLLRFTGELRASGEELGMPQKESIPATG
jgi:hypothetical protein